MVFEKRKPPAIQARAVSNLTRGVGCEFFLCLERESFLGTKKNAEEKPVLIGDKKESFGWDFMLWKKKS